MISSLAVFERSVCACAGCQAFCRSGKPGCLAPGDVDAIADYLGLEEASEEFLRGSFEARGDGPKCAHNDHADGETPAIRPKIREDGSCLFLSAEGECRIHKVAPFECSRTLACDAASGAAAMKRLGEAIAASRDYLMLWNWLFQQQAGNK